MILQTGSTGDGSCRSIDFATQILSEGFTSRNACRAMTADTLPEQRLRSGLGIDSNHHALGHIENGMKSQHPTKEKNAMTTRECTQVRTKLEVQRRTDVPSMHH